MTQNNWLILDMHNLAWRAFHGLRKESVTLTDKDGVAVQVLYGTLNTIRSLYQRFQTRNLAFCFDLGPPKRLSLFATYKQGRRPADWTDEEVEARASVHDQIGRLREDVLPRIGFGNILAEWGYEADDMAASAVTHNTTAGRSITLVSSDKDLYQLLTGPDTWIYSPQQGTFLNRLRFTEKYGVTPEQWPAVKAMMGDPSDGIPGIKGIGETYAVKYLRKQLKQDSAAYRSIRRNLATVERNRKLITLPFDGCPVVTLRPDKDWESGWDSMMASLKMNSLLLHPKTFF